MQQSNMHKRNLAICVVCNQSYIFALSTLIVNLKKISMPYDKIIVYCSEIEDKYIQHVKEIDDNVEFIRYSQEDFIKEHQLSHLSIHAQAFISRNSHLAYIKYKVVEQLEYFKKIIFTDLDVIFKNPVYFEEIAEGISWRLSSTFKAKFSQCLELPNFEIKRISYEDNDDFKLFPSEAYALNAGYFSITDKINYQDFLKCARSFIARYINYFNNYFDELTISYATYKCGYQPVLLVGNLYNVKPIDVLRNTKHIHFMGGDNFKPWESEDVQLFFPEWLFYYKESLLLGDANSLLKSKVKAPSFDPGRKFKEYLCIQAWTELFRDSEFEIHPGLSQSFDLTSEQLYFNYKPGMKFELKISTLNNKTIQLCFWVTGRILCSNAKLRSAIDSIVASNSGSIFVRLSSDWICIHTSWISRNDFKSNWDWFVKIIEANMNPFALNFNQ